MSSLFLDKYYNPIDTYGSAAVGGAVGKGATAAKPKGGALGAAVRRGAFTKPAPRRQPVGSAVRRSATSSSPKRSTGSGASSGSKTVTRKIVPKPAKKLNTAARTVGTTVRTAPSTVPANTRFGSYDINTLRKLPANTYSTEVARAAANRQYDALVLLQSAEGRDYWTEFKRVNGLARNAYNRYKSGEWSEGELKRFYDTHIVTAAPGLLEKAKKWKKAFYSASWARNPDLYGANPIKIQDAKEVENEVIAVKKATGVTTGLGTVGATGKGFGPVTAGFEAVAGDLFNGVATGHLPDGVQLLSNFTNGILQNVQNPQIPAPTVDVIKNMLNNEETYKMFGVDKLPIYSQTVVS